MANFKWFYTIFKQDYYLFLDKLVWTVAVYELKKKIVVKTIILEA